MWILDFYKEEKERRKKEGKTFLLKDLSREMGYTPPYLSHVLSGKGVMSVKFAEKIEEYTDGVLKAEDQLEYSIEKHKKYLARKERFGDRLKKRGV